MKWLRERPACASIAEGMMMELANTVARIPIHKPSERGDAEDRFLKGVLLVIKTIMDG